MAKWRRKYDIIYMIDVNSDSSRRLVMQLAIYKELIKEKNVYIFLSSESGSGMQHVILMKNMGLHLWLKQQQQKNHTSLKVIFWGHQANELWYLFVSKQACTDFPVKYLHELMSESEMKTY